MEAMLAARPVVISDIAGLAPHVSGAGAGIVVKSDGGIDSGWPCLKCYGVVLSGNPWGWREGLYALDHFSMGSHRGSGGEGI